MRKACRCGGVQMTLAVPAPSAGTRVTCHCRDCQTAAQAFGGGVDILNPAGGTEIWQTTPDRLCFERGEELLEIRRLSPKGLYRWVARCCDTPMINTMNKVHLPFAGVVLRQSEVEGEAACLGPSRCLAFTKDAMPGAGTPAADRGFYGAAFQVLGRMAQAWLSGRARRNPLVAEDGTPIAPVSVISREARQAATPEHLH
ncbi:DUF6151 family protein [Roseovarius bejariae]